MGENARSVKGEKHHEINGHMAIPLCMDQHVNAAADRATKILEALGVELKTTVELQPLQAAR